MTSIRVMLDYVHPWPNAAGFYVARDRGWYRDAGLEVELTTHDYGRGDALAHLGRYEVDFAVFPSNRLLVRREKGESLIGVAAISQTGLETIQAIRSPDITRPRDLEGRRPVQDHRCQFVRTRADARLPRRFRPGCAVWRLLVLGRAVARRPRGRADYLAGVRYRCPVVSQLPARHAGMDGAE